MRNRRKCKSCLQERAFFRKFHMEGSNIEIQRNKIEMRLGIVERSKLKKQEA